MTMTRDKALAVLEVAAKRLRAPGVAGIASGPFTADELDQARAYFASLPPKGEVTEEMVECAMRAQWEDRTLPDPWDSLSPAMQDLWLGSMRAALTAALNTEKG